MSKELVSVIVPVYNGEKFIDKCMDSLINQTYRNIEVIIINDGSNDSSQKIIDEYTEKYPYIKCIKQENKGVSISRNVGIDITVGDYITVLDVDDWFDYDFIEKMLSKNMDYDIIISGYRRIYEDGKIDFEYLLEKTKWNQYKRVTVWAKLYKRQFLQENKITYPNVKLYGENVVYTMRCMSCNPKVGFVSYIGYNNLVNENSITHQNKDKLLICVPLMIQNIDNFICDKKAYLKNEKNIVEFYYIKLFSNFLVEQSQFLSKEKLRFYFDDNIKSIKEIFERYGYKFTFCWQKQETVIVNLFVNLVILSNKLKLESLFISLLRKMYYGKNKA